MGVVFGEIIFSNIESGYEFFKRYCLENQIDFTDCPEDSLITTRNIPNLKVFDPDGIEIKGEASSISGMDKNIFELSIEGIEYPFYENEFPHHVSFYNEMFKGNK